MDDYHTVDEVYDNICRLETGYRGLDIKRADCLLDTIDACICIIGRGSVKPGDYVNYAVGINAVQGHLFDGRITGESAAAMASEVMYLASSLLSGQKRYDRIKDVQEYRSIKMNLKGMKRISSDRNAQPEAYAYMIKSFQLLNGIGLYTDSVLD